jgi:cation diffusion facilitator CzcD-associated flavoprotein CzcO
VTDLVEDGWTDIIRNLQVSSGILMAERLDQAAKDGVEVDRKALSYEIHQLTRYADYQQMEKVRARADIIVQDSETAEALKPYYQQFCKRPCFHDDYLGTFNRDNVTLVDTDGQGIERFTPKGVVVNGR